ncbi:MAG: alcohol dehydrogenase catalytic domain-containing protein [Candidatus Methylomirabilales bacterium]
MKALVKTAPVPGAALLDIEEPRLLDDEVLIQVKAGAICGTDIHFYHWDPASANFPVRFPLILGHEYAGDVVAMGRAVAGISVGDRVSVETHIPCGRCYQCGLGQGHNCQDMGLVGISYPGAFAPYAKAPAKVAYRLPASVSYEAGALFEPAGVAMRGVDEAQIAPGDLVVILGCGPIGLLAIQMAMAVGAGQVIAVDVNAFRLELARGVGAVALDGDRSQDVVEAVRRAAGHKGGADVVIELSGAPEVYDYLFDLLRLEGRLVTVGHVSRPVSLNISRQINLKGVALKGVFGRRIWQTWEHLGSLVANKRLDLARVITHRFPLDEFDAAFRQVHGDAGKVLFIP